MTEERCDQLCVDIPKAEALRERRLGASGAVAASAAAKALADPTRLIMAQALREGEPLCVCELSWIAERSQPLVSSHVQVLRRTGLATSRRDGASVIYELTPGGRALVDCIVGHARQ